MEIRERVRQLLAKMTLEEKIGQTNMLGGSIYSELDHEKLDRLLCAGQIGSVMCMDPVINNEIQRRNLQKHRLHIPILFCGDIIHGIGTIFPIPLAESCSWDPGLAERTAAAAAKEGAAFGCRWTFAPMTDIGKDVRWGRVMEGAGEDPLLGGDFAAARVRGFQGNPDRQGYLAPDRLAACVKHFAGYGLVEGGKEYAGVTVSERELQNIYFKPYERGIRAGALTVMSAFHDLNGIPCTVYNALLDDTLRRAWDFDGVLVTDYNAIAETIEHGYCRDGKEAALSAARATVDIDMVSGLYVEYLKKLVEEGALPLEKLDRAVSRILTLKFRVGIMDHPFTDESRIKTEVGCEDTKALARECALRSAVLLENDGILPLRKGMRIALVGPLADDKRNMLGNWSYYGRVGETETLREGLTAENANVLFLSGPDLSAISACDCVIAAVGHKNEMAGEACSLTHLDLPEEQVSLVKHAASFGKPVILVVIAGRPLVLRSVEKYCSAILYAWHLGTCAGSAIAELLIGKVSPSGRLSISFPRSTGQCPVYYYHTATGRPPQKENIFTSRYLDEEIGPRWPFGYGLSYSKIRYNSVRVSQNAEQVKISLELENRGNFDTYETVQVYCRKCFSKPVRPVRELVGYRSLFLKSGEIKKAELSIPIGNFFYLNEDNHGEYEIFAGKDSTCSCCAKITL